MEVRQQFQHLRPQAVRTGGDGQGNHLLRGNGLGEKMVQICHGSIGVGKTLKVGDVFFTMVLSGDARLGLGQLDCNVSAVGSGKVAAARFPAEEAATGPQRAIPVGTGHTAVQCNAVHFFTVSFF